MGAARRITKREWICPTPDDAPLVSSAEEDAVSLRADLGKDRLGGRGGVRCEAEPGRGHARRPLDRGRVLDELPREPQLEIADLDAGRLALPADDKRHRGRVGRAVEEGAVERVVVLDVG